MRLIEILSDEADSVSCILHDVEDLEDCGPYIALSYVWGAEHPQHEVTIGGANLMVRENLWLALRALKNRLMSGWGIVGARCIRFYIDAICINQKDGKEKERQVNLMEAIFKEANSVVAWLGEGEERWGQCYFKWLGPGFNSNRSMPSFWPADTSEIEKGLDFDRRAALYFLDRTYWKRLWIVQEIWLAKEIIIMCGSETCSWKQLAVRIAENPKALFVEGHPSTKIIRSLYYKDFSRQTHEVLSRFSGQDCSIPQDKVFGLLGLMTMARRRCPEAFSTEYTRTPSTVFHAVANYLSNFERISRGKPTELVFLNHVIVNDSIEYSEDIRRARDINNLKALHLLSHQMGVMPPHSRRMIASIYLEEPIVDNTEMARLFPLDWDLTFDIEDVKEYLWDSIDPDPETELEKIP